ncbi:MAG: signal peptidase I [Clostridia bacterium]|nr:signal peptidase I [Clostridia bacterium]
MLVSLTAIFLLPRLFGYQPYMVVSASMQQSFPVGSLIFVREAAPEEIEVGDPITFNSGTLTITHRVMSIDREKQQFITKGDSNNVGEVTPFANLKGKALDFSIPYLGYFSSWFITAQGRIITAIIILCAAALSIVIGKMSELDGAEEEGGGDEANPTDNTAKEGETIDGKD